MANVGILTCSSAVQEMGCSGFACFDAAYDKTGEFSAYPGDIRIKGIISCSGCPGKSGIGKILRRVNSLIASGIDTLNLGNCMVSHCPFITRYEQAIQEAHPALKIVRGVHAYTPEEQMARIGERYVAELTAQRPTTPEIVRDCV
jgi:predicted metal-binding protein